VTERLLGGMPRRGALGAREFRHAPNVLLTRTSGGRQQMPPPAFPDKSDVLITAHRRGVTLPCRGVNPLRSS